MEKTPDQLHMEMQRERLEFDKKINEMSYRYTCLDMLKDGNAILSSNELIDKADLLFQYIKNGK